MNSLTVASERDASASLVEWLFNVAIRSSKATLRAAQYSDELRTVSPEHHIVMNGSIEAASDGWGVVGAINELGLETSSETQHEMRGLLVSAVHEYFEAEKVRGSLQGALSTLHIEGLPSEILVSLYVKEEGDMHLAEVMRVAL